MKAPSEAVLRPARPEDAGALLAIYAPYVEHTAITFEYDVPSPAQFRDRIAGTLARYPYLVAQRGDQLLGYAYTGPFGARAAYDWSAAASIYLRQDCRGQGLGRQLYQAIEEVSRAQNLTNLAACIAFPEQEDPYLTQNSVRFHAHMGYRMVGRFDRCGYKFGRWYHMVWMEKLLGPHPDVPQPVIPFPQLDPELLNRLGIRCR